MDQRSFPKELPFVAVLVFRNKEWCTIEPRLVTASHPEQAYQLALASSAADSHGHEFVGLADLYEQTFPKLPPGKSETADATSLVVPKEDLRAFRDPRWKGASPDQPLHQAFQNPEVLVELQGLESVPWHSLSHAYGPATDVPYALRHLASSHPRVAAHAIGWLHASVLHQGSIYDSTLRAIPFIVQIAADPIALNRAQVVEFLWIAAESSSAESIRRYHFHHGNDTSLGCEYLTTAAEVREELLTHLPIFQSMERDSNREIQKAASRLIAELTRRMEPEKCCPECGLPLLTPLAKQCFKCGADWH